MKAHNLITVLGWEDRFLKGVKIILENYRVRNITLILFMDYFSMDKMDENLAEVKSLAESKEISLQQIHLKYNNSISNWKDLNKYFKENHIDNALLNLTTIPRETIWTLLFYLRKSSYSVDYIYFKPETYFEGWLTKNHKEPRLLFKHSGVFDLDNKLALFVISGFDELRLRQLIEYYEPHKLIVFSQSGEQYENLLRNKTIPEIFEYEIETVKINTYDINSTSEVLNQYVKKNADFNIIIASQGPKTSSISTYKTYLDSSKRIGLAYVPARDFNAKYSSGVKGNFIVGNIDLN